MARRRHKRLKREKWQSQAKADWEHEDEVELLAWLDYILSTTQDAGPHKDTFVKHLEKKCETKYTIHQIERKIRKFWSANRYENATDPNEIYRLGTKCLPYLPNKFKKSVQERWSNLRDEAIAQSLQNRRQLRSASRTTDSELSRHISLGVEVAETPSPRKRHRESLSGSAARDESMPRKRRDGESQLDQASNHCTGEKLPKQEDEFHTMHPQFMPRVVDDSEDELTDDGSCDSSTIRLSSANQSDLASLNLSQAPREDKIEHPKGPRSIGEEQTVDINDLQTEKFLPQEQCQRLQEVQKQHQETIKSLRHQLSIAEKTCEDLKYQLVTLDHAYPRLNKLDHKSIFETLKTNEKVICELQEALNDKERLRAFSTLASYDSMPFSARKVKGEMASIGDTIKRILSEYEDDSFSIAQSLEGQSDVKSLFLRSFGLDLQEPSISVSQAFELSTFSFQAIIRTLIASALCEWVFEADLDDVSETPCALLQKYRLHLDRQDGAIALRNLDFAAHASLIEEEFFQQHVIPAKATVLADRLIHTLSPFFLENHGREDSKGEAPRAWSTKKGHLKKVFENALRIKAQATVSKDTFEMVLFNPGTAFNEDIMDAETMEGGKADISCSSIPLVKLCLLPSLHVYEHNRRLVDYNNFERRPSSQRSAAMVLTEAVVILEST